MINLKNNYDIVIIDSGVNLMHPLLKDREIYEFSIYIKNATVQIEEDFQDYYGHGTAVYSIISEAAPDAKILNLKVLNQDDGSLTCEQLILALQYVYDHIDCRIINLSIWIGNPFFDKFFPNIKYHLRHLGCHPFSLCL